MMNLGLDLETEILVRLPLKSLMRFRCVQRSWNILIQTPSFLKRRHINMSDSPSLMILFEKQPYVTLLSCDNLVHIKSPFSSNSHHLVPIESYGSCNGVFCLKGLCWYNDSCVDELIILNPTSREVHRVPHTPCLNNESYLYGFGADDSIMIDFKFVKLRINYLATNKLYISSAEVYSVITKSWTPTLHPPPPFTIITRQRPSKYNTLVNGVYHWITNNSYYYRYDGVANILCFNFRNDQFHQLRGPTLSAEDRYFLILCDEVAEIKGSLAYVVQCHYSDCLKIWVMDQSGWDKKYNIGPIVSNFCMRGLWKNGDQLLGGRAGKLLTSYDHQGNSLCQFQIDVDYAKYFWIHEYVPSIAPLST